MTTSRLQLLWKIASEIADYRVGEIERPTPEHVERWVQQFDSFEQDIVLSATARFLDKTYMSRSAAKRWLEVVLSTKKLVGTDAATWLRSTHFLRTQKRGRSQEDLLQLLDELLQEKFGFTTIECGSPGGPIVYLDDCIYTGNHVRWDLLDVLKQLPAGSKVYILTAGLHDTGRKWALKCLEPVAQPRNIDLQFWRSLALQTHPARGAECDVLHPAVIPDDPLVEKYITHLKSQGYEPQLRSPSNAYNNDSPFPSEVERQALETAFLKAGAKIIAACANPQESMRPLGYMKLRGFGFGSTFATYRNIANNAPLALWWGDPQASPGNPLRAWYPLMPRRTNDAFSNNAFS